MMDFKPDRNAELEPTLQSVLENHALPKGLGRKVAEDRFAASFGSTLPPLHRSASTQISVSLPWLLVAVLVGVLVGYIGLPAQGNRSSQIMMAQMYGRGGPWSGVGPGTLISLFLPASAETLRVILLVFVILFVTRNGAWRIIFPQKLPAGLTMAKLMATLAAIFGLVRVVVSVFVAVLLFGDLSSGGRSRVAEFVVGIAFLIDQLWWVAFWVAALAVVLVATNVCLQRYLRPLPSDR